MAELQDLVARARQLASAGRLNDAISSLQDWLREAPQDAARWHELGLLQLKQRQLAPAAESWQRAAEIDPGNSAYWHHHGLALSELQHWAEAEQSFRQAIGQDREHTPSRFKLAELCERRGAWQEAALEYQAIREIRPNDVAVINSQASALLRLGQRTEAIEANRAALALEPRRPELHHNLGNSLRLNGELEEAAACLRSAIALRPDYVKAYFHLADILWQQAKLPEAFTMLRHVLQLQPRFAEAHEQLALVLQRWGRNAEAVQSLQAALQLRPNMSSALGNLGTLLNSMGRREEALRCLLKFVDLRPRLAEGHNNLGNAYLGLFRYGEAQACYQRAITLRPRYAKAEYNLGKVHFELGNFAEAAAAFERAMEYDPQYAEPRFELGAVQLLQGNYAAGWRNYESRWGMDNASHARRTYTEPVWDGSPLAGRTILLYTEQGFGDTFQFIRYARLVKERGGQVLVECQPRLIPLMQSVPGVDQWIPRGQMLPPFDVQCALLSLPAILGATAASIPRQVPYLAAQPRLVEKWREALSPLAGFRVGIVWQGSPTFLRDGVRSIPLVEFEPLARVPGVQLIALQKGPGEEQLSRLAGRFSVAQLGDDIDQSTGTFMDTAAILTQLDLLISSDTSTVHLAGALGLPVWVALGRVPDWRWLLERSDCPWYPTLRIFRQRQPADWSEVFCEIAAALQEHVTRGNRPGR